MTMRIVQDPQAPGGAGSGEQAPDEFIRDARAGGELTFPCSSSQQRCWFINSLNPGNPALNIALRWEIKGRFNTATIEQAFQTIIDRHEILRTRFDEKDGEPIQQVAASHAFKLSVVDQLRFEIFGHADLGDAD